MMIRNPRDEIVLHIPALRAFALSLTRNSHSADDLVQDTVERGWKHIASFKQGTNLRSWLFTILRNGYLSELRKRRREVPDVDGAFAARLVVMPDHDEALALREFLAAFERLSTAHREVLTLVGALGFSYEEAAEVMEVAVGTAKSRACRARMILTDLLGLETGASLLPDRAPTMPALRACAPVYAT